MDTNIDPVLIEKLAELVRRAEQDEPGALQGIRELYDQNPDFWHRYGDLTRQLELALVDQIGAGDVALKEAALRKADELRDELAGQGASPLENLLAGNIATCWLATIHADLMASRARGVSLGYADYLEKRRGRAQQRFLAATKALATVRKLITPPLSPVQVATKLERKGSPARRESCTTPVGVLN